MNALISVSDKTGVLELATALAAKGVKLLSTGGTAKLLADAGLAVTEVADMTGFPEMLDGRVKTLHPKVHGGLLARRDFPEHMQALKDHGIDTIDFLIVNLYPFEATVAKANCTLEDAIENIDIGGPAMIRAAAKNYGFVAVATDEQKRAWLPKPCASNGARYGWRRRAPIVSRFASMPRSTSRWSAGSQRSRSSRSAPSCSRSRAKRSCASFATRMRSSDCGSP